MGIFIAYGVVIGVGICGVFVCILMVMQSLSRQRSSAGWSGNFYDQDFDDFETDNARHHNHGMVNPSAGLPTNSNVNSAGNLLSRGSSSHDYWD